MIRRLFLAAAMLCIASPGAAVAAITSCNFSPTGVAFGPFSGSLVRSTGTITFTLYLGQTLVDTETASVSANGSYTTPTGYTLPSTGTVTGTYHVYTKLTSQRMTGGVRREHYDLPNVPNVMYFYSGYAIHGTYWHHNFGHPMSHGCVNASLSAAAWLFKWTPVGTPVKIHY